MFTLYTLGCIKFVLLFADLKAEVLLMYTFKEYIRCLICLFFTPVFADLQQVLPDFQESYKYSNWF